MPPDDASRTVGHGTAPDASASEIVDAVIKRRFACRVFSDRPVSRGTISDILAVARYAPSAANTQPGHVYVVTGPVKEEISAALLKAHEEARDQHASEYAWYANPMPALYDSRRQSYGRIFYGALGVDQADMAARARVTARNYGFFGAPVGLIVTIDRRLALGSWIDVGILLQNIMIAASARGLDTCPQQTFSQYHTILRQILALPEEEMVVCGMSLGYADEAWLRSRAVQPKLPVEEFVKFVDG